MGGVVETARGAEQALLGLLDGCLSDCSVQDLDGLLIELAGTAARLSNLAVRVNEALGRRAGVDCLRLDADGETRFASVDEAVGAARACLVDAAGAAGDTSRLFDTARQVTAKIGLAFNDGPHGVVGGGW